MDLDEAEIVGRFVEFVIERFKRYNGPPTTLDDLFTDLRDASIAYRERRFVSNPPTGESE